MPIATAEPGTIILDGVLYKILAGSDGKGADLLQVQQLGSYQQGVTIGSPDVNSHPFLSTWGIKDLTGGHGLAFHLAGTTDTHYRYSTIDVSRPGQWAPRWAVATETGTAGTFMPLGDLLYSGNVEMYGAFGTDLHIWNESSDAWTDTTDNLAAAPVNPGVAFQGTGTLRLFIPTGSSGYSTYTGATKTDVAASASVPAVRMFCVFGSTNLIALATDGQLWYSTDGSTWASYGPDGKIDGSLTAYGIYETRDATDSPILIVNTSGRAFTFDPGVPKLYTLDLQFPNHPNQGLAASVWRGVYYITVGMGIHSYTGSTIGAMGLDRDEGLPALYGYGSKIASLAPEYNNLYALVQGGSTSYPSVHRFDGYGWHSVWEGSATGTVSKLYVSGARSTPRIWWGVGNNSYTFQLPIGYSNPRQVITAGDGALLDASGGYLQTGMTDMGMPGSRKIAVSVGCRMSALDEVTVAPAEIKYRLRENDSWTTLVGPMEGGGPAVFPAVGPVQDATYYYWFDADFEGVAFDEIELQVSVGLRTIVKWVAMYFMKVLSGNLAWTAAVDFANTLEVKTDLAQAAHLDSLITSGRIVDLVHRETTYKVRVSAWNGADSTGRADGRSTRTISLIEIRDRP